MGHAKRQLEEDEFDDTDVYVCGSCVTDVYIREVLQRARGAETCSFCGNSAGAPLRVLLELLSDTIEYYYNDPAGELPHDSAEGGYQGQWFDGYEFIQDVLNDWTEDSSLLDTVAEAFGDRSLCKRDYFALTRYEALRHGWDEFASQVKYRTRYLFFPSEISSEHHSDETDGVLPHRMLEALGTMFGDYDLFRSLDVGTSLKRARVVRRGQRPRSAEELGTAPRELATLPNRMSPAGIPMFYAAFDTDTAILETFEPRRARNREVAMAEFRLLRMLRVLDLSNLPPIPSYYDPDNREHWEPARFLHAFERELTRPVQRDGLAHAEYAPTQVVTEYVRHRMRDGDNRPLDGILYRSSKDRESVAVVVFADPEHCGPRTQRGHSRTTPFLELVDVQFLTPPFSGRRRGKGRHARASAS